MSRICKTLLLITIVIVAGILPAIAQVNWTWVAGDNGTYEYGIYNGNAGDKPGTRTGAATWVDNAGNLWLFGGIGDSASDSGDLNDLWMFNPGLNKWTWEAGGKTSSQAGVYTSSVNTPGARAGSITWTDNSGNLWLFGGEGYGARSTGPLNDLWEYSIVYHGWSFIGGNIDPFIGGTYGTKGAVASQNIPGARAYSVSWKDNDGNLWLYGGVGVTVTNSGSGILCDLWKYNIKSNGWTWVSGDNTYNQAGVYGTKGVPSSLNKPGGREEAVSWTDQQGNFWLFGGLNGVGTTGCNDLWEFIRSTNQWIWVSGNPAPNGKGVYNTIGVANPTSVPGSRHSAVSWQDSHGNFWLFGGAGFSVGDLGSLNDLWLYSPSSNLWTYMGGAETPRDLGVYGTKNVPSTTNKPGARYSAMAWSDNSDNLWLFGGQGYVAPLSSGYMGDLWRMNYILPKQAQTIIFLPIAGQVTGAADFNPGGVASSGLAITYSSSNLLVATIVNGNVRITGPGTTIITASQAGNASYLAAASVNQQLTVKIPLSSNATLANLATSAGTLSPVFAATTSNYTASVPNTTTGLTITPATSDAGATIKINGVAVTTGTASANLPLAVGKNIITAVVTAQDGITTQTYTLTVTRAASGLSTNALLSIVALTPASSLASVTGPGYRNYTTTVPNSETSVQVTAITQDATATIKVNGTAVSSGTASQVIPLNVGSNLINVIVTAQDGATTKIYTLTVTRASGLSTNALLSVLALTPASSLAVVAGPGYKNYATTVLNSEASVRVTAITRDVTAAIKVNGVAVTSGTASQAIPLNVGSNIINVVVTAQDGITTKTYTLTVTRASGLSTNALLSVVALTPASSLAVVTGPGYKNYATTVLNGETSVRVTAITQDATATIKVNGTAVASGTASQAIVLNVGSNVINVIVTAQDGITTKSYTLTVTRISTNALLSIVALTPASSLAVVTGPGYKNYTTSVPNSETSVQVTSIAQDATATIKVNGTAVASGTASQSIPLNVGSNVINVIVTAQDGITTKTYIITATRAMASMNAQYIENPDDTIKIADDGILVHSAVSPNGDGKNDVLTIDGLAKYPDNKLIIMNRSGVEIYQVSGYDNVNKVFDGHSNKTMAMQKPGTYFYQLEYNDQGKSKYKTGYILLKY